ncbi:hypothetical protein [Phenylobacterium sp.]|uniref:hypothetical protein n=1 Tax=Phenylobacterium sp. TaxID=1871053 RepID=UPI003564463A
MRHQRVLFIDDDQIIASATCEALRDYGYRVTELHSASEALAETDAPDPLFALVSDINLGPGPDGFDIAKDARPRTSTTAASVVGS